MYAISRQSSSGCTVGWTNYSRRGGILILYGVKITMHGYRTMIYVWIRTEGNSNENLRFVRYTACIYAHCTCKGVRIN